jgi:serine/threonine protein kinase
MNFVPASSDRAEAPLFADGIGERVVAADGATGELLQILRLRPALTAVPSFEFALRERTARLANFRHASYARVRRIDRVQATSTLAIVCDHVEGIRLSDILRVAQERRLQIDVNTALYLVRQLVPAVALLHENARDVTHGLLAPERLIVTPYGRLVIVEHVLAAAIEQLQFSRERLWQEFRIAMPPSAGLARFDHRADVTGIGAVTLALLLGRPLRAEEFPQGVPALLNDARERSALGEEQPLSPALRAWLARALQLDVRRAYASAPEALAALEEVVADGSAYAAAPIALETFMSRYITALLETPGQVVPHPSASAAPPAAVPLTTAPQHPPIAPRLAPPAIPEPQVPAVSARDITELISPQDLDSLSRDASKPLFNADAPFTLGDSSRQPVHLASDTRRRSLLRVAALLAGLLALAGGGVFASRFIGGGTAAPVGAATTMGTLIVQSNPPGAQVFVDGVSRGMTPTRLSVTPGAHILELRGRGVPRVIPLQVAAGAQVSQYLEFAETPTTGQLTIQSQPEGARVMVDGTDRGIAPLTVSDLAPGDHEVLLQSDSGKVRHVVTVQAGATASLVAPMTPAAGTGPVSGWVSIRAPFTIEIREEGRLLGTTDSDRIMMAAGRHDLELVNEALAYRSTRTVQVPPGKVATVTVALPHGVINLNAAPWAEVWIDGQRVGETPIGNLGVPIGPHEIVFRHPQLGEKRHAISVTLAAPARLSVDMK